MARGAGSVQRSPAAPPAPAPLAHPSAPASHRIAMKVPAAALAALLLVATCAPSQAHLDGVPTTCCFSYVHRPVPRGLLTSAYTTSSSCSQPGLILVTKKKKELCADPQAPWAQAHLKHFQSLKN